MIEKWINKQVSLVHTTTTKKNTHFVNAAHNLAQSLSALVQRVEND